MHKVAADPKQPPPPPSSSPKKTTARSYQVFNLFLSFRNLKIRPCNFSHICIQGQQQAKDRPPHESYILIKKGEIVFRTSAFLDSSSRCCTRCLRGWGEVWSLSGRTNRKSPLVCLRRRGNTSVISFSQQRKRQRHKNKLKIRHNRRHEISLSS